MSYDPGKNGDWDHEAAEHGQGPAHQDKRGRRRLSPGGWTLLGVIVFAIIAAAGLVALRAEAIACAGGQRTVVVTVSPSQQEVVEQLADEWNAEQPTVDGRCIGVAVAAKDSADVAAALGPSWDEERDGPLPHVWVPESSMWLAVAAGRPDAAEILPAKTPSIASSPVVLAVYRPLVQAIGWPDQEVTQEEMVALLADPQGLSQVGLPEGTELQLGLTEPTRSISGMATVLALLDRNGDGVLNDEEILAGVAFTRVLGDIAPEPSVFLEAARTDPVGSTVAAFPALEQDLAAFVTTTGDTTTPPPFVPIYPGQDTVLADYPYAVLRAPWVEELDRTTAELFLNYLRGPAGVTALGDAGFRGVDGATGHATTVTALTGVREELAPLRPVPEPEAISTMLTEWTAMQRPANVLLVLDTSGSMDQPVPGTGLTRLQLLQQTALAGFELLTNQTSIGLWEFAFQLTPTTHHRELVPFGPTSETVNGVPRLNALQGAVAQLGAIEGTCLHHTAYAAYQEIQEHWEANSTNVVLLITDGRDEYCPDSPSTEELVGMFAEAGEPDRPTPIIGIALGTEADADAMTEISQATGGRTFVIRDPAQATETLILAFAGRLR